MDPTPDLSKDRGIDKTPCGRSQQPMSEIPFHSTVAGRRFYEHTMPRLVEELARINASLAAVVIALDRLDLTEASDGPAAPRDDD